MKLLLNGFLIFLIAFLFIFLNTGCNQKEIDEQATMFFELPGCNVGQYTGQLENGLPHGEGSWFDPASGRYEGFWFEGQFHGKGTFTWPDGKVYEGEWKNGYQHGSGVMYYPDGTLIDGIWRGGRHLGS